LAKYIEISSLTGIAFAWPGVSSGTGTGTFSFYIQFGPRLLRKGFTRGERTERIRRHGHGREALLVVVIIIEPKW